jgi:hypothetical protein
MAQVAAIPLLTASDEAALGRLMEQGSAAAEQLANGANWARGAEADEASVALRRGAEARATLIRSNLRLLVSIARRYQGQGLPILISSRRAVSASSGPPTSSTTGGGSSSRLTRRGGSARRSPGRSRTRLA